MTTREPTTHSTYLYVVRARLSDGTPIVPTGFISVVAAHDHADIMRNCAGVYHDIRVVRLNLNTCE